MARKNKRPVMIAETIARDCIGVRIRLLNRVVTRLYDDALREHGLKLAQMNLLTAIALRGPIQPARLGRLLSLEKSTLSRNLRVLEANGWANTRAGVGNTNIVRATAAGKRLLGDTRPAWRKAQEQVRTLMGAPAVAALAEVVDRIWQDDAPR